MTHDEWHSWLEKNWWNPFAEFEEPEPLPPPPKRHNDEFRRRLLQPSSKKDLRPSTHEYRKGYKDWRKGKNKNPYPAGSLKSELWELGWRAAKKKKQSH